MDSGISIVALLLQHSSTIMNITAFTITRTTVLGTMCSARVCSTQIRPRQAADGFKDSLRCTSEARAGRCLRPPGHGAKLSTAWRGKRGDLLWDLRLRAFLAQASEVPVVSEEALLGPATRCHVPLADDAVAPKTAHVAPAELALFGPRYGVSELPESCRSVEPIQLSLHAKPTI